MFICPFTYIRPCRKAIFDFGVCPLTGIHQGGMTNLVIIPVHAARTDSHRYPTLVSTVSGRAPAHMTGIADRPRSRRDVAVRCARGHSRKVSQLFRRVHVPFTWWSPRLCVYPCACEGCWEAASCDSVTFGVVSLLIHRDINGFMDFMTWIHRDHTIFAEVGVRCRERNTVVLIVCYYGQWAKRLILDQ